MKINSEGYKSQFLYDKNDLNANIEKRDTVMMTG